MVLTRAATLCLAATLTLSPLDRAAPTGLPEPPPLDQPGATGQPARGLSPIGDAASTARAHHGIRWASPTRPLRLAAPFDPPAQPWLPGHRGVDLVTTPGQVVHAAGTGRIAFTGSVAGHPVLSIDHGRLRTTYQPVTSWRRVGERVTTGDAVGTISAGTGHCGHGGCLHLGLRRGEQYLDPLLLIGRRTTLLRPW